MAMATLLDAPAPAPDATTAAPTNTTQQTTKPPAPTGSATSTASPVPIAPPPGPQTNASVAPSATASTATTDPVKPPPLSTTDPLAFAPKASTGSGTLNTGNTQSYVAGTPSASSPGALGYGAVPGSNGGLLDLGSGQFAPTPGADLSQGVNIGSGAGIYLPPDYSPFGMHVGDVTSAGKITGWNQYGNPIYDSSVTNAQNPDPWSAHGQTGSAYFNDPTAYQAPSGAQGATPTGQQTLEMALRGTSADPTSPLANRSASVGATAPASDPFTALGDEHLAGSSPALPTSPASDVGAGGQVPSTGFSQIANTATGTNGAQTGSAYGNAGMGVNLTPTTVDNALTNSTISPGAATDRFGIARQQLQDTIKNVLDPQFATDEKALNRYNFGAGRGVSGDARTSQGNLELARQNQINQLTSNFLNPALTGSIEDAYRNIGIAQQQQGFQNSQQQQNISNMLAQLAIGSQGDPTAILQWLSGQNANMASGANAAASGLQGSGQNVTNQQTLTQNLNNALNIPKPPVNPLENNPINVTLPTLQPPDYSGLTL
jgi:hypothetical protein